MFCTLLYSPADVEVVLPEELEDTVRRIHTNVNARKNIIITRECCQLTSVCGWALCARLTPRQRMFTVHRKKVQESRRRMCKKRGAWANVVGGWWYWPSPHRDVDLVKKFPADTVLLPHAKGTSAACLQHPADATVAMEICF